MAERTPRNAVLPATFWDHVEKSLEPDGCWEWSGARMGGTHRYGQIRIKGKTIYAHRLSFEAHVAPLVEGQFVLHRCDNPPCIRPEHLFAGSAKDNAQDMLRKGRARNQTRCGSKNNHAKLTEQQVREIRGRYAAGDRQTALAAEFGVTQANISVIVRGEGWKHVPVCAEIAKIDAMAASFRQDGGSADA